MFLVYILWLLHCLLFQKENVKIKILASAFCREQTKTDANLCVKRSCYKSESKNKFITCINYHCVHVCAHVYLNCHFHLLYSIHRLKLVMV